MKNDERLDKYGLWTAAIAYYVIVLGAIVAVWQSHTTTLGGGIAATGAIVFFAVWIHGFARAIADD